jgi:group I intron endonuclease
VGRLRNNKHKNQHLQFAYNKYGEENFEFKVILYCEKFELLRYEQELINRLNPHYNICKFVKSKLGWKTPPEVIEKIRCSQIGKKRRPHTQEEKLKFSLALKGRKRPPFTEEWKNKIRIANIGKKLSEETRRKISCALVGRPVTPETRKKISDSNKHPKIKRINNVN